MATQTLDLNRCTVEEIVQAEIPQVSRDRAEVLVSYREENGSFESWDEVKDVPGFSDEMVENLRDAGMVLGQSDEDWEEYRGGE
ncbi:MAG: ComEA family DNA-binding protein [Minisyncoccia bacterium]